jgi:hypothetical protein
MARNLENPNTETARRRAEEQMVRDAEEASTRVGPQVLCNLRSLQYPRHLHKPRGLYLIVDSAQEAAQAIGDGWFVDANDALKAGGPAPQETRPAQPPVIATVVAPALAPDPAGAHLAPIAITPAAPSWTPEPEEEKSQTSEKSAPKGKK